MLSLSLVFLMTTCVSPTGGVDRFEEPSGSGDMTEWVTTAAPGIGLNEYTSDSRPDEPITTISYDHEDTFADDKEVSVEEEKDVWQDYLIRVGLQVPWNDGISQHSCQDVGYLHVICQQVKITLEANSSGFIGTIPNAENMVEVIFEGLILKSQFQNTFSALRKMTIPDYSENIAVHVQVIVTLLQHPNTDIRGSSKINIQPVVGPMSGGTPVTIKGYGLDEVQQVNVGHHACNISIVTPVLILCTTPMLADAALVDQTQNISLQKTTNDTTPSDFFFTYLTDPNITLIEPTDTIVGGGVLLTVHGTNLNIVRRRLMILTVTKLDTGTSATYQTTCTGDHPDYMLCPTPPIALVDLERRHRRSEENESINFQHKLLMEISFVMDGVETFKNLSGTHLQHCSALTVHADPVFAGFEGISQGATFTFTPTWPVSDKSIGIKGERLLTGLRHGDYTVYIGEDRCTNMKVSSDRIECQPPPTRPQVAPKDNAGYNKIPVKVLYAGHVGDIGNLRYVQTLWEYRPVRYTILGLSACLLPLIILIVVCCFCSLRRRYLPLGAVSATAPNAAEREQAELLEEIRLEMSRRDVNNIPKYVNDTTSKHNVTPVTQRAEDRFIKV